MRRDEHNGSLHAWAATGAAIVTIVCSGGLYYQKGWAASGPKGPALEDLEVIEASIAYKKAEPEKQPQKKKRAPVEKKVEGVSRDEKKEPVEDEKDEPKAKPDDVDPLKDFRRENTDEDLDIGKPVDDPGVFDPDAPIGWAEETKGDPYFRELIKQLRDGWSYPELLGADGVPVGCMRLERDGRVSDTLFKQQSGNAELDDSVERALKALEKARKDDPPPVPSHLLKHTTRWICFKFEV